MKHLINLSIEITLSSIMLFFVVFIASLVVGSIVNLAVPISVFDQAVLFGLYAVIAELIIVFGVIVYYLVNRR